MLARFDRFLTTRLYDAQRLDWAVVEEYTTKTKYETVQNHMARSRLIKQVGVYLQRLGIPAYLSPVCFKASKRTDFVPYIFSMEEIVAILNYADRFPYSDQCPQRHRVLPMLLRILYCCGLRVSEALNIQVKDMDLQNGLIHIRQGKFNKERLVPMSEALKRYAQTYIETFPSTPRTPHYYRPLGRLPIRPKQLTQYFE